jgi:hypothetical protein
MMTTILLHAIASILLAASILLSAAIGLNLQKGDQESREKAKVGLFIVPALALIAFVLQVVA